MQRIGRYIILRRIASGGMAEILLAKLVGEAGFEKTVVIKKILPQWASDHDFITMLVDEAKIAVQLDHPNIVSVYELSRDGDDYYIAMEFVSGVDLRRLMQKVIATKKRVPPDVALFIVTEILEGLSYAHTKRDPQGHPLEIIHRDISPQNILISYDGAVKIADFGIARAATRSQETVTGVLKGKFAYMSPEQASQEDLDARSDLFATAIVLYEIITGERLFHRGSDLETLERVRRAEPIMTPQALKRIPDRLKEVLFKALMKSREERFQTAASFREALVTFARRSKKTLRREKVASFLESLFKGERETKAPPTMEVTKTVEPIVLAGGGASETEEVRQSAPHRRQGISPKGYLLVGVMTLAVFGLALHEIHQVREFFSGNNDENTGLSQVIHEPKSRGGEPPTPLTPPEVAPPVDPAQALPLAEPPPEPTPLEQPADEPPPPMVSANELKKGYLSLQAIPWGSFSIDAGSIRETPVRRIPLKPGRHTLRVNHPPTGATVSKELEIRAGREIVCIASFHGGKEIRCEK